MNLFNFPTLSFSVCSILRFAQPVVRTNDHHFIIFALNVPPASVYTQVRSVSWLLNLYSPLHTITILTIRIQDMRILLKVFDSLHILSLVACYLSRNMRGYRYNLERKE